MAFPFRYDDREVDYSAMYRYNDQKEYPKRKGPRLKGYHYNTPGYYFVTSVPMKSSACFGVVGNLIYLEGLLVMRWEKYPVIRRE